MIVSPLEMLTAVSNHSRKDTADHQWQCGEERSEQKRCTVASVIEDTDTKCCTRHQAVNKRTDLRDRQEIKTSVAKTHVAPLFVNS